MTLDIMMPFWGRPDHLREAVQSVLAQSDPDWRLVVVDDVYPDTEPGRWVQSLGDPRIRYLRNAENLGVGGNFRECVRLAEHERVVLMGCDDRMLPGFVGRVRSLVDAHPGAAIVQPGVEVIDAAGAVHRPLADRVKGMVRFGGSGAREFSGERLLTSLLHGNWAYFPSLVWRRDDLVRFGFRPGFEVVQDLALIVDVVLAGGSLLLDDETVFQYRRHAGSVSALTGPDATKFGEESALFAEVTARTAAAGWGRASRAARLHLTSRLNALTELPAALRAGDPVARRALLRHALG
ncbi:glycosyltransferase [Herbiconiux moechotypicola]|uniref:Glycosyltransferase 2-like domain-containing protein n=1 Tax=Herbiconiux moechotypicola TaxID=637393 RepID=A0ABN3DUQ8_9MICO|nr:glycosyltransferase [Herbiconiux moechotypicola]MCS5731028.1 glycosyltransferase [Herbiconiux moechotypicola]